MVSIAFETNVVRRRGVIENSSNDDSDGIDNGKKSTGLDCQNNNFARASRFFVHSLAVTARLRRETA